MGNKIQTVEEAVEDFDIAMTNAIEIDWIDRGWVIENLKEAIIAAEKRGISRVNTLLRKKFARLGIMTKTGRYKKVAIASVLEASAKITKDYD